MKMNSKLSLVLIVVMLFYANLNSAQKAEIQHKKNIIQTLQQKYQHIQESDITLSEITNTYLRKNFNQANFYDVKLYISLPPDRFSILAVNQSLYRMPTEFNHFLQAVKAMPQEDNIIDIAFCFCLLTDPEAIPHVQLKNETVKVNKKNPN
ncbi:hypothetical protein JW964_14810, partial [candidate division KSB1 bacterium]|nr:hypothetical protein [candidate division KSB1 bacterium]